MVANRRTLLAQLAPMFGSQTENLAVEDGARPDLARVDQDGEDRVLIEAKFWAGLTENQPGWLSQTT